MPSSTTATLQVPRTALWVFGLLLVAPWALLGGWLAFRGSARSAPASPATPRAVLAPGSSTGSDVMTCAPGPWGSIQYVRILIEPPAEFIPTVAADVEVPPWVFVGYSEDRLSALWRDAGLSAADQAFLSDPRHRLGRADAIVVKPDRDFIINLNSASRAKIYAALGEFPENDQQLSPYRLHVSAAGEWLQDTGISADAMELTKRLMYQRGNTMCFSDDRIVIPTLRDATERKRYIKALSRKSAVLATLKVAPGENVAPLVAYWGRGGRSKDLDPLLESLAARPQGGTIDIAHLLPRFARTLLYTYPLPTEDPVELNHDCHWTAFNFNSDQPDEKFADADVIRKTMKERYRPVIGDPALGDIIMFTRPDGVVLHSCIYIADDIVFTKNGPGATVPWLLSRLSDVEAFYSTYSKIELRRYRERTP